MKAEKLHTVLRVVAVITTLSYLSLFFGKLWSRSRMLHETGVDIDWAVPANPQSMIALCLVTATVALLFLRSAGRAVALALFLLVAGFYVQWGLLTSSIRENIGVSSIPQEGRIGNLLIGANPLDPVVAVVALLMVIFSAISLLQERSNSLNQKRESNQRSALHPRHP